MIDSRCISIEDLSYPAPGPGPGTSGVDALGSQETCLKFPKLSANHRKASPSRSVVSRRTPSAAGERHPSGPGLRYPEADEHAQLTGRGGWAGGEPRTACSHAGNPLPWQPSHRVFLRELSQPADPVARSPLPPDFRVGLEAEGQQKMAERSQTVPEAGNDMGNDDAIGGNVSKYMVFPSGYCGQSKKGHLIFDACFESGNLGRVDQVSEFEYDLFIRPDTCNPRFRVWFNFTVENVKESQRVIFNIVNFSKTKSLYRDGMAPMVKSTSRPKCFCFHKHVFTQQQSSMYTHLYSVLFI
uniref:Cytosolic carboxypeptidase 3-like n=1 Tax=Callorhinus ursinus TaxID=34884 RepID=A0A3Q7P242_CALUR|nr:cytosolic carboxypeptidase 3-like [Callorhinus ursinus]